MKTTAYNLKEVTIPSSIPNGSYSGIWGGYEVIFKVNGKTFSAKTSEGIRGFGVKCSVSVHDGDITVSS